MLMAGIELNVDLSKFHPQDWGRNIVSAVSRQLKQEISWVVSQAKSHHRFQSHTRMLEKSIVANDENRLSAYMAFSPGGSTSLMAEAHLDDGIAFYGKYVHEGQKAARFKRPWKPDQFLFNALEFRSKYIDKNLENAINEAIRKAG
jgi:hypothetical protein